MTEPLTPQTSPPVTDPKYVPTAQESHAEERKLAETHLSELVMDTADDERLRRELLGIYRKWADHTDALIARLESQTSLVPGLQAENQQYARAVPPLRAGREKALERAEAAERERDEAVRKLELHEEGGRRTTEYLHEAQASLKLADSLHKEMADLAGDRLAELTVLRSAIVGCAHHINDRQVPCPPMCPRQDWPRERFRRRLWLIGRLVPRSPYAALGQAEALGDAVRDWMAAHDEDSTRAQQVQADGNLAFRAWNLGVRPAPRQEDR